MLTQKEETARFAARSAAPGPESTDPAEKKDMLLTAVSVIVLFGAFALIAVFICSTLAKNAGLYLPSADSGEVTAARAEENTEDDYSYAFPDNGVPLSDELSREIYRRMGIIASTVSEESNRKFKIPKGAEIDYQLCDYFAVGDVIVAVNGTYITSAEELAEKIDPLSFGSVITTDIFRESSYITIEFMLDRISYGDYPEMSGIESTEA